MSEQLEITPEQNEANTELCRPCFAENMLLPQGYFKVYGQKLADIGEPKMAWGETEKEFNRRYCLPCDPVAFRRFDSYESFTAAYRNYNSTGMPSHIKVFILTLGDLK